MSTLKYTLIDLIYLVIYPAISTFEMLLLVCQKMTPFIIFKTSTNIQLWNYCAKNKNTAARRGVSKVYRQN